MASVMEGIPDVDGLALKPSWVKLVRGNTQDQLGYRARVSCFFTTGELGRGSNSLFELLSLQSPVPDLRRNDSTVAIQHKEPIRISDTVEAASTSWKPAMLLPSTVSDFGAKLEASSIIFVQATLPVGILSLVRFAFKIR